MANPWFRMYAEFATDPKVQMMSEADQRRFIMLLCMRCGNDAVTLHDDEVAFQLRISAEDWAQSKDRFLSKGLIDKDNQPTAWESRQFISDSSAERVRRHRAKKSEDAKRQRNVTETPPDTDTDTEQIKEANASSAPSRKIALDADGNWTGVSTAQRSTWETAYPALSLDAELAKAAAWILANPKNKKSNYARYLTNWLSRAQDSARPSAAPAQRGFDPLAYINRNRTKRGEFHVIDA